MCQCRLCERHRRFKEVLERRDVDELVELATGLAYALDDVEFNLEYVNSILDGTWPGAREQLEVRIREMDARQEAGADRSRIST